MRTFLDTVWTVNDVSVNLFFFFLVDPYPFYCMKRVRIDSNKKGMDWLKSSLTVLTVPSSTYPPRKILGQKPEALYEQKLHKDYFIALQTMCTLMQIGKPLDSITWMTLLKNFSGLLRSKLHCILEAKLLQPAYKVCEWSKRQWQHRRGPAG